MDAVEFLKEAKRYCKWCKNTTQDGKKRLCEVCYFEKLNDIFDLHLMTYHKFVEMVEQWAKEHPVKTRQSEFLKMYPSALIDGGSLCICPKILDPKTYSTDTGCNRICNSITCRDCRRNFWLKEIE